MARVLILGCSGAGKSTLARRLGDRTGLPVVHFDTHYWNPGWVETPPPQWEERVAELAAADCWIMDGNYAATFGIRIGRADTIVFLDLPRRVCLWRVFKRLITHRGRARPDVARGCNEKIDLEFLAWIWRFRADIRPQVLRALEQARVMGKQVHRLTSSAQVRRFITSAGARR